MYILPLHFSCGLLSDRRHIFFFQGASVTVNINEEHVLRFAHADFDIGIRDKFYVYRILFPDGYYTAPFEYRFEMKTPLPYHAELHINVDHVDYEGKYFISQKRGKFRLRPNFVIYVNGKLGVHVAVANQIRRTCNCYSIYI